MTSIFWGNFGLIAIYNVLSPLFAVLLVLAISRLSGPELLGKYSLMMAVFIMGQSCATLGLQIVTTREAAQDRARAGGYFVASCLFSLAVVTSVLAIVCPLVWWMTPDREFALGLVIVLVALVPSIVAAQAEAVLLGFEDTKPFVLVGLIERLTGSVVSAALVFAGHGVAAIGIVILVLRLAATLWLVRELHRRRVSLWRIDLGLCRRLLKELAVMGSIPVVNAVYSRLDLFLIGILGGFSQVGLYSAAARLVDLARVIPMSYARAIYPVFSKLQSVERADLGRAFAEANRVLLLMMFSAAMLLVTLAEPSIAVLYGHEFHQAGAVLRILSWSIIPFALASVMAQMLFAANLAILDLKVNIISLAFSAAVNVAFIRLWGATGAATTAVLSSMAYAGMQYLYVTTRVTHLSIAGTIARIGSAAALGLIVTILCVSLRWSAPFVACVPLAVYLGVLVGNGSIRRQDLAAAYAMFAPAGGSRS